MPRFTSFGVQPISHQEYYDDLAEILRQAFGEDVNLAIETPQGQLIELLSRYLADLDLFGLDAVASLDLNQASGWMLDRYGSVMELPRKSATRSQVEVIFTGRPFFFIPAGLRVSTFNGVILFLRTDLQLDEQGVGIGILYAATEGSIDIPADSIIREKMMPSYQDDIISISNPKQGIVGADRETDIDYRTRYLQTIQQYNYGTAGGLEAALRLLPGVRYVSIIENTTSSPLKIEENIFIPSLGFMVIIEGGDGSEIVQLISDFRSPGTLLAQGGVSYIVNNQYVIGFYPVEKIAVEVEVVIEADFNFPVDGLELLREYMLGWFAGDFERGWEGVGVGELIEEDRFRAALYLVPHHTIKSVLFRLRSLSVDFYTDIRGSKSVKFDYPVRGKIFVSLTNQPPLPFEEVYDYDEAPEVIAYPNLDSHSQQFRDLVFIHKISDGKGLQVKEHFSTFLRDPPELYFYFIETDRDVIFYRDAYASAFLRSNSPLPTKVSPYKKLSLHPDDIRVVVTVA